MIKIFIPLYGALLVVQAWALYQAETRRTDSLSAFFINLLIVGILIKGRVRQTS